MLDELREEAIVNKVGGRFKLSTLIQKRMVALNTGAKPLVEVKGADKMAIVVQEILEDKIYLDNSGNVQTSGVSAAEAARRAMVTDVSDSGVQPLPVVDLVKEMPDSATGFRHVRIF